MRNPIDPAHLFADMLLEAFQQIVAIPMQNGAAR